MSTPLYKQLQSHPYPSHQYLDKTSALWLVEQGKPQNVSVYSLLPKYAPFPISELNLRTEWFADAKMVYGIHGARHLVRVAIYAWIISQYLGVDGAGDKEQMIGFLQAAMVHDIRRIDDNADIEHGRRSADWIVAVLPKTSNAAVAAVRFHAEEAPRQLDAYSLSLLNILKTADALDRFRLPRLKWWPDKDRMPLEASDELLEFCKYVTLQTELETCGLEDVDTIVKKLEIWLKQEALI